MKFNILIFMLLLLCYSGFAGEWHVDKDAKNLVKFTSEVVVLTFDGVTDNIDGYIYWEGETAFEKNTQMLFEVDLNTLDTDNGKRDRDMREVLETDKWQVTTFEGTITNHEKIDSAITAYHVTVKGKISIHGVEKELEAPGKIAIENGKMHVVSDFSVYLNEHNIEAPSLAAFVKVSEEILLHLDFYLKEVKE